MKAGQTFSSVQSGETVRTIDMRPGVFPVDALRNGVTEAMVILGTGFFTDGVNTALRAALKDGLLDTREYYRQILHLMYRLMILCIAEERDILLIPEASRASKEQYWRKHSVRRLRHHSLKKSWDSSEKIWKNLVHTMEKIHTGCADVGLSKWGSFLWKPEACKWLIRSECSQECFTAAIRALAFPATDEQRYVIDWKHIGADSLGEIYESMLELHPQIDHEAGTFILETWAGNARKTTGSYYTPASLVECVLDSTLEPVLLRATNHTSTEEQEKNLLAVTICDAACGAGHFLLAAARRLAMRLAQVRSGTPNPENQVVRQATRDVVSRCIYGVDINPMAVELCKLSLWMEAPAAGTSLSFLDSHILCGNALLGTTPALMAKGIPDHAFVQLLGDETSQVTDGEKIKTTKLASRLRKRNKAERKQHALVSDSNNMQYPTDDRHEKFLADMWCAAFVWPKKLGDRLTDGTGHAEHDSITFAPTTKMWQKAKKDLCFVPAYTEERVQELAEMYQFFHWHLAFPQIFKKSENLANGHDHRGWKGGFTVMVGNPPWERIKLQEKEFFASRDARIAHAQNATERKQRIQKIPKKSQLWADFQREKRLSEGSSHIIRNAGNFPLCGRGDVNTYSVFAELNRNHMAHDGFAGCIVPTGIAVDDTTKYFFQDLMKTNTLLSLFDFENRKGLFPHVHRMFKFCAITMSGKSSLQTRGAQLCFFAHHPEDLRKSERRFTLTIEDIERMNPNTGTCPIFQHVKDASLTKWVYGRVPVLWKEKKHSQKEENPWSVTFCTMFHMSRDSDCFRSKEHLEHTGWILRGNVFERGGERYVPLMEAKFIHHYNHRFSTFNETGTEIRSVERSELKDVTYTILPRYWVPEKEVKRRLKGRWERKWLLGYRWITNASNERTFVCGMCNVFGTGNSFPLIFCDKVFHLAPILQSLVVDYISRQFVGGMNFTFGIMKQMPVLSPEQIADFPFRNHVLELSYTAWDMQPFAKACGYDGPPFQWDEQRRLYLRCELDAYFFHKYLGDEQEWEEKASDELKTHFATPRDAVSYIMVTFPILKRREEEKYGEYRSKKLILMIFDNM